MAKHCRVPHRAALGAACVLCALSTGCMNLQTCQMPPDSPIPRELNMIAMPTHVIQPNDTLTIEAGRLTPKGSYRIQPLDELRILVTKTLPDEPIDYVYIVEPEGKVRLGGPYGSVQVAGLTLEEAEQAIKKYLEDTVLNADVFPPREVTVALESGRSLEDISGEYPVRPDGMINLSSYGSVFVAGLTPTQAKAVIDEHLAEFLDKPNVTLDVPTYNGVYYLILDRLGEGEVIYRNPVLGRETVLDVLSETLQGLPANASKRRIWVARPAPPGALCCDQMLPVDWTGITQRGNTTTNYQILPGDRIYVKADVLSKFDQYVDKVTGPFQKLFDFAERGLFTEEYFRAAAHTPGGIFSGGFGGFGLGGFPGFGFGGFGF